MPTQSTKMLYARTKFTYCSLHWRTPLLCFVSTILLSGCLAPARALPTPTPWPTPALTAKEVYTVQRGTMTDQFKLNGQVVPVTWEPLSFRVDGQLATLHVQEGDTVEPGDLLAELAMPDLLDEFTQAQLALEQAQDAQTRHDNQLKFDLARAKLELRKAELRLADANAAGGANEIALREVDVELARLAVEELETGIDPTIARNVTKTQLAVETLERQVEDRRLRAPFAGQLIAMGIGLDSVKSMPNRPKPRAEVPAYTPFMLVAETALVTIIVDGGDPRANELEIGQVVSATYRFAQDDTFALAVTALPTALENQGLRPGFPHALQLMPRGEHPPLIIGDWVAITVVASVHEDTLILPDAAVRRFAGRSFVVLEDGDRQRRVDIQTGLESNGQIEILDGVSAGDIVIGR